MSKKATFILLGLFVIFSLSSPFVLAQEKDTSAFQLLKGGFEETAQRAGIKGETSLPKIIGRIIYALLGFLGVIFLTLIIVGGFMWMTAAGNEEKIKKAKGLLGGAAIGLIIILASYTITFFVIERIMRSAGVGGGTAGEGEQTGACQVTSVNPPISECYNNTTSEGCQSICQAPGFTCTWLGAGTTCS